MIRYLLTATALLLPIVPLQAETKADDRRGPDAVRCVKLTVTGSLVRKERICKTNAEWTKIREQQSRDADDLITRSRAGMNPNG